MAVLEMAVDASPRPLIHRIMTLQQLTPDIETLQRRLGHEFSNPELLIRALTHASATEQRGRDPGVATYQRLEFLGDRVLGLIIAHMLAGQYPDASEGELSKRLARLVNGETCAEIGRELELDRFMIVDGNVLRGGKAAEGLRADICESIIGALYLDGGLDVARKFVEAAWTERIVSHAGPLRDAKTELQEWAHRKGFSTPLYREITRSGPDHAPTFEIEVIVHGTDGASASGSSKREAEHIAAETVLRRQGIWKD